MTQNPTRFPETSGKPACGFTLTELLVVIAIVAVLAALSLQAMRSAMASARASKAVKSLQQIALANIAYSIENDGRIVGLGNGIDWKGQSTRGLGIMGRLYPYVSGSDKLPVWKDLHPTFAPLRDANVPVAISEPPTPDTYQKTWACNDLFAEYPGPKTEGRLTAGKRMHQFDSPDRVVYVISGSNSVKAQMGEDKSQVPLPAAARNGIYYSYRSKAPSAFLDGHGELLSYPIKPRLFDPSYGANP
jgi:prepilin-type N-terminal cleavage/methylation domain-containing protein